MAETSNKKNNGKKNIRRGMWTGQPVDEQGWVVPEDEAVIPGADEEQIPEEQFMSTEGGEEEPETPSSGGRVVGTPDLSAELAKLKKEYQANKRQTDISEIAEKIGHALARYGAAREGQRAGVDVSKLDLPGSDFDKKRAGNLAEYGEFQKPILEDIRRRQILESEQSRQQAAESKLSQKEKAEKLAGLEKMKQGYQNAASYYETAEGASSKKQNDMLSRARTSMSGGDPEVVQNILAAEEEPGRFFGTNPSYKKGSAAAAREAAQQLQQQIDALRGGPRARRTDSTEQAKQTGKTPPSTSNISSPANTPPPAREVDRRSPSPDSTPRRNTGVVVVYDPKTKKNYPLQAGSEALRQALAEGAYEVRQGSNQKQNTNTEKK